MKTEKIKEGYHVVRGFDVNDELAKMSAKLDFNTSNGNIKMTFVMTTKHLSFNEVTQRMVLEQFSKLGIDVYTDALELRRQHLEADREGLPELQFPEQSDDDDQDGDDSQERAIDDESQPSAPSVNVVLQEAAETATRRKRAPRTKPV